MSTVSRLKVLDEYGNKKRIMPAEVHGRLRRLRNYTYFILMLIFLGLPWISIDGTQAVLLDIPGRRFELFGMVFLSHDSPLLFFLFAIFTLGIMLITALWGRVWCGWACPQTVFIDAVYRRIEQWIEGNYIEQRKLHNAPLSFGKFTKYSMKWFLFFTVSSLFAHSFIAYFVGSEKLLAMMNGSPKENWSYFLIVTSATALLLFNFGWFREQFCLIMCPYGRFQSVLMDQQSLTIVYDQARGEPRKGTVLENQKQGDCVSCNRCVQVCPTAIDIRDGVQMECIGCTACIDACDEIMTKVNKPCGLIAYRPSSMQKKVNYLRPRVAAYFILIALCSLGLTYNLSKRQGFSVAALRGRQAPYQLSPEGLVINHFRLHLHNQSRQTELFKIELVDSAAEEPKVTLTQAIDHHELKSGESKEIHLFVQFPKEILDSTGKVLIKVKVIEASNSESAFVEFAGVGPSTR